MPSLPKIRRIPTLPFAAFAVGVFMDDTPSQDSSSIDPCIHRATHWALLALCIASLAHFIILHNVKGRVYAEAPENQNTSLAVGAVAAVATAAWVLRSEILGAVWWR